MTPSTIPGVVLACTDMLIESGDVADPVMVAHGRRRQVAIARKVHVQGPTG